ncbi:hypothetical protein BDF21DRAFT_404026 [Thamnidium elegans]|nr:hypothetical protein BDF21DRAFT_404026 [Thamnidium elegans]
MTVLFRFWCYFFWSLDRSSRRDKGDVYIDGIKQYILNIDQANEEHGEKMEGLTIQKVVTDCLKVIHALAIERLENQEDFFPDKTYFLCDIDHSSFGASKIEADSTESFNKFSFDTLKEYIGEYGFDEDYFDEDNFD